MAACRRPRVVSALLALCCLALPSIALAQGDMNSIPKGVRTILGGVVREPKPSKQVAAHATVIVESEATGEQWETRSDGVGNYLLWGFPPGSYTVIAESERFTLTVLTGVEIRANKKNGLDITLGEGHRERLTVRSRAADQKTFQRDGSLGASFSVKSLETRPLSHGNTLQSLLPPVPGVVITDSVGTHATSTALGQRRFENRLTIDGAFADLALDVTGPGIGQAESGALPANSALGGTQTLIPLAAVEEIRISTTNAAPESARAPGAQTVIVTRAGGDRLTGGAFINERPDPLAASDWFVNAGKTPRSQNRYRDLGASIGGPVLPRRVSYFAAAERQRIDRPLQTTIAVPSHATRAAAPADYRRVLDSYPMPNGRELGQGLAELSTIFPVTSNLSSLSVRLDTHLSGRHGLFTRVNVGRSSADEISPELRLPRLSFSHRETTQTATGTLGLTSAVSSRVANEFRLNVTGHRGSVDASAATHDDAGALPMDLLVPDVTPDAWVFVVFPLAPPAIMGGRTAASAQRQIQVGDTVTLAAGRHEWRLGGDYVRVTTSSDGAPDRYTYRFLGLSDPRTRVVVERRAEVRARRESWSLFAQDMFRISSRFSLHYGVRYEAEPAPTSLTGVQPALMEYDSLPTLQLRDAKSWWKTQHSIGPQAAASYQLGEDGKTKLHAGWGLTYAPLTNPGATPVRGYPFVTRRTTPISTFPVADSALTAATTRGDYYSISPNLRRPRTHDWYVGIDQSFPHAQSLSLAYVGAAARDLVYWHGYDAQGSTVHAFSNSATSDYHAMLVQYALRKSRRWNAQLAYTLSHAIDLDSGEPLGPHPPPSVISPDSNRGSADFDRRHNAHVWISYRLPTPRLPALLRPLAEDWQIDAVTMIRSGAPLTVYSSRPLETGPYWLRPDLAPGVPVWIDDPDAPTGRRLNADAFQQPTEARQGTLGRNALRASPLRQLDLAVSRAIRVGPRFIAQLRIDAFNVFNVPNFGAPETAMGRPEFGRLYRSYADALGTGTLTRGGLVPIQQVGGPRSIQIRVGFTF